MRVAWLTDVHLNFVSGEQVERFFETVLEERPEAVLLTGDIGEARDVDHYLALMDDRLQLPIYFVLGNHDFYFGSIRDVRRQVSSLCRSRPRLHYLSDSGALALTDRVGVLGHDGWADGRIGDYETSYVMMNDYKLIAELAGVSKQQRWPLLNQLGDEAAAHVRQVLPPALEQFDELYLLTHVPPMREACWHEGCISDDEWAPHFTCKALGDAVLQIMAEHPRRSLTVLCGHTHGAGQTQPLPNVKILTGGATYGAPAVCERFELPGTQFG